MTSIASPILDYAILALSTMILVGLPIGLLLKRREGLDYQIIVILISMVVGTAVVMIEYARLIQWCYSLEQMPLGLAVGCQNFLPGIQLSALIGLALAVLMAYFVVKR